MVLRSELPDVHDSAAVGGDNLGCLLMHPQSWLTMMRRSARRPVVSSLSRQRPGGAAVTEAMTRMGITAGGVVTGTRGGTGGATVGTLHRWLHLAWCSLICCNRPSCRSTPPRRPGPGGSPLG